MSDQTPSIGDDPGEQPNYLARRLIVTGAIVGVIALVAVGIGRLLDDGGGTSSTVNVDTSWDTMVTVDAGTGRVTMSDPDGSDVEGVSASTGRVSGAAMIGDTVFLTGARASVAMRLTGDRQRVDVSDLLDGDVALAHVAGTTKTIMFTNGTSAVFMGEDTETLLDTAATVTAPGVRLSLQDARANVDGSSVLIPDLGNFQSVLLMLGEEEASYFAGVPLAVDDDRVATAQTVGAEATVTVTDHDGTEQATVTTQPVLAAMLVDDGLLTVDGRGAIHHIDAGGDEVVGNLGATPAAGASWVAPTGDRLLVATTQGISVIDQSGEVLATVDATEMAVTGPAPPSSIPLRQGCQVVVNADSGALTMLNLRDGEVVIDVGDASDELPTSADGCTGIVTVAGRSSQISSAGRLPVDTAGDEVVALSPDGDSIVVARDRRLVVRPTILPDDTGSNDGASDESGSDGDSAGDLGPVTPYVFFADL